MSPQAFFLPANPGQRFCLYYPAQGRQERGGLIYVHPLAEEMNKSRRQAALQAKAFAEAGYSVLQIDLYGCGDSSGDFGDATWEAWSDDLQLACGWLQQRCHAPLWLWGLRAGCLIAAQASRLLAGPVNFLFWQPFTSGEQCLQQFLRLKMAGALVRGETKGFMSTQRQLLERGQSIEIAGYLLSASLARGLGGARLMPPLNQPGNLLCFELASDLARGLSPTASTMIEHWQGAGIKSRAVLVEGPAFWQTPEIEWAPQLLAASLKGLDSCA